MTYKIVFVHLLNDLSGSPKVLAAVVKAVVKTYQNTAKLYVGSSGNGFLSTVDIPVTRYWYRRTGHKLLTLFTYLFSQGILFCKLLCDRSIDKDAVVYVNTLLPFGAALYGGLTGRKVIYHVHEISITPAPLKCLLTSIAGITSSLNIYVSEAHMQALPIPTVLARRVYNALDFDFVSIAEKTVYAHRHDGCFNVLMIAYLRDYKGVPELITLAHSLREQADIRFDLVVNDDQAAIERYFNDRSCPRNLTVHPRTSDTASFYARASLVMNLSRADLCVETFGMTILEAMAFGIPVIVPPVGGPAELIEDGKEGFWVDSSDAVALLDKVMSLYLDEDLCLVISKNCREKFSEFSCERFSRNILESINSLRSTYKHSESA